MKRQFRVFLRNWLFALRRMLGFEKQSVMLGEIREAQILSRKSLGCLADAEFSVFSQWGEDGILAWLVNMIQPENPAFVEFGVEDYRESNTRYLLISKNWRGLVIDGSKTNIASVERDDVSYKYDLATSASFITAENINEIIGRAELGAHVGIISTDIDGVDYWVLKAIETSADIVTVEYNALLGVEPISVPYDPAFVRHHRHWSGVYWGASLNAFRHLLESRAYIFVGTNRAGTNAFFVAGDKADKVVHLLNEIKVWPCLMRDVRDEKGALAFRRTRDMGMVLADMPFANVVSGSILTGRDCLTPAGRND